MHLYSIRNSTNIPSMNFKHLKMKYFFFQSIMIERNRINLKIENLPSCKSFKENNLRFIRLLPKYIIQCYIPEGIKCIAR